MADDLSTANQPEGTTRIENGIAYDISGKALGPAKVPDTPEEKGQPVDYGALAKQAGGSAQAPDYAALAKQAGGSAGDDSGGAPDYTALAKKAGGRPAPTTVADLHRGETIGPRHAVSAPVFVPLGAMGGFTIPEGAMSKFHSFLEDVQTDVKNGTHSTWVGSMLDKIAPGGWKGTHYGVSEGAGNFIDTMTGPLTGIPEALEAAPELTEGHPVRAANKLISGGFKTAGPILAAVAPEAMAANPEPIIYGMATQRAAQQTALAMGADEDTAELVGNVTGIFAASKIHSKVEYKNFEEAVNARTNAGSAAKSRMRELDIARQQSEVAQQKAVDAAQKELNGQGTKADTDAARTNASEAAANQAKAQKAFDTSRTELAEAQLRLKKFSRGVQEKYAKNIQEQVQKTKKGMDTSRELMQKAIPAKGTDLYEPDSQGNFPQYETVRSHLEAAKDAGKPIGSILDARNVSEQAREGIEAKVMANVDKYADEPLVKTENPEESIKGLVRSRLQEMAKEDGNFEGAEEHLDEFNLSDISVKEGQKTLTKLNNYLRAMKKSSNNWDIYNQIETNPKFAAYYFLADELREKLYDNFEDHGITGIKEAREETKNLINFRNAADAQLRRNMQGTVVRGSEGASPVRKLIGKFVRRGAQDVGAGVGAKVGGIPGAVIGADVGAMLGGAAEDFIAPEGMTRDQHVAKSMSTRGTTRKPVEIKGEGTPPVVPSSALPKEYPYPSDLDGPSAPAPVELSPREHSELHAALAAYSKQTDLSKVPYEDLEKNFRQDMQEKIDAGVDLTPKEGQLLEKILQADAKDNAIRAEAQKTEVAKAAAPRTPEVEKQTKTTIQKALDWADGERPLEENPILKSLGREDESGLVSHSAAMKAHSVPMEITDLPEGMTSQMVHRHEWAHVAIGSVDGLTPLEIRSELHPKSDFETGASAIMDLAPIRDKAGNVDPDLMRNQFVQWITMKMAGAASHEVFDGLTTEEALKNPAILGDLRSARTVIRQLYPDFSPSQIVSTLTGAYNRARAFLTQPHIADRIKANADVREDGLSDQLHASNSRVIKFAEDIREAHNEHTGKSGPDGGPTGEGSKKAAQPEAEGKETNAGRGKPGSDNAARSASKKSEPASGGTELEESKVTKVPPERSTGRPEADAAIKEGGAIPGGVQKGFEYVKKDGTKVSQPALAYFHDPKTGTSLNLPLDEVTPEAVKEHLAASRKAYGIEDENDEHLKGHVGEQ